jgi:DNA (cytosine-5)-methyltransferase 1
MNGLSLFSGIGGLDLGLERAGITVVGQVEIDPWCRRVLARHWPSVPQHDDVRTAADWWLNGERPHVDLVFGGFPCQDISNAGQRAGIDGSRSGLWRYMAAVIRDLRPRYVVLENVSDLLVRGVGRVLGDLAEIGYDAEWDCVPAAAVGAHHLRDRWFAVAYPQSVGRRSGRPRGSAGDGPDGEGFAAEKLADPSGQGRGRVRSVGAVLSDGLEAAPEGETQPRRSDRAGRVFGVRPVQSGWANEPGVGRLAHGIPAGVVRPQLRGYGNAVVPQVAEHVGRCLMAHAARGAAA